METSRAGSPPTADPPTADPPTADPPPASPPPASSAPAIPLGPFAIEPRLPTPVATPRASLDAAIDDLRASAAAWMRIGPRERRALIDETIASTGRIADRWTDLAIAAEGLDVADPISGEEAVVGPYLVLRGLRGVRASLREIERTGRPRIPGPLARRPDGRLTAPVFPRDSLDRLLFLGVRADVWFEDGMTPEVLGASMARAYRQPDGGGVCLVLGGGNVSSIGPLDVLQKVFVENRVVVLKTHPVNAYLDEILDVAFAPLIRAGVLRIVHGDAVVGGYLCRHPGVDEIHITGSDRTYEAIVYGAGPEGHERKLRDEPILQKPFTAELGNVTPVIVVPGRWSDRDLERQADNVATMLTNNAGFNCTTARALVTHAAWDQRDAFLDRVRARLAATPPRSAWYPGARERFDAFTTAHPEIERIGSATGDRLPWGLVAGLSPDAADDPCYRVEAFCSITAETPIQAPDLPTFLERAVAFANETLWGTLNATLIVDPATERAHTAAIDRAVADLRYGTVALNHWSAVGFGLGTTPWGAFPGHHRTDIQSGIGWVHNALMLDGIQKTVIHAPFRAFPKPPWFSSHRTAHRLARRLVRFEANRSPLHLPAIAALALRG